MGALKFFSAGRHLTRLICIINWSRRRGLLLTQSFWRFHSLFLTCWCSVVFRFRNVFENLGIFVDLRTSLLSVVLKAKAPCLLLVCFLLWWLGFLLLWKFYVGCTKRNDSDWVCNTLLFLNFGFRCSSRHERGGLRVHRDHLERTLRQNQLLRCYDRLGFRDLRRL